MIHSLRFAEPVSSFRSTFAYTNITHILASRIVAQELGAEDWNAVVAMEIFKPLGMKDSSLTAEAIEAAANHASGHRWAPDARWKFIHAVLPVPARSTNSGTIEDGQTYVFKRE